MTELNEEQTVKILTEYSRAFTDSVWRHKESVLFNLKSKYGDCFNKLKAGLFYDIIDQKRKKEREKDKR